ncbi:MAG: response regulator transcription factor [Atopobiaceae bacterium]|jgi:two-component system OmpR family response regulator
MTSSASQILIIEDDADIRESVSVLLEGEGYDVLCAPDGAHGLALLRDTCDLVILDVMMPGMSGIDTCKEIRRRHSMVPILFLSAKTKESDKAQGLLSGGDDYLSKPFSYTELLARVKALMRRYHLYQGKPTDEIAPQASTIVREDLEVGLDSGIVRLSGEPVDLTDTEFGILRILAERPDSTHSAREIFEAVWGLPYEHSANATIMTHISRLRNKVERDPKNPAHIKTVWGRGYRFE